MIIQYFTAEARCLIEKTRLTSKYLEMRDGAHPITNDSVWQDDKRRRQPVMVIFEGILSPMGGDLTEEDLKTLLTEIELMKLSFKKPSYSTMFWRALTRLFQGFIKYGLYVMVMLVIAYMLIQAVLAGGL